MSNSSRSTRLAVKFFTLACCVTAILPSRSYAAGSASLLSVSQTTAFPDNSGLNPFLATATAAINGSAFSSVTFTIRPIGNSLTRPLSVNYSASYLQARNMFTPGSGRVTIPIFGLYNAPAQQVYPNVIDFSFQFTDGSSYNLSAYINTNGYTDPCIGRGTFKQYRKSVTDLGFDYILLKSYCGQHSPAIIDTDGYIRWIGVINGSAILASNIFYDTLFQAFPNTPSMSSGSSTLTGINQISIPTGTVTKTTSFRGQHGIVFVGDHNIDRGRNGTALVGVDTNTIEDPHFGVYTLPSPNPSQPGYTGVNQGSVIIETDGTNILNVWDFSAIIHYVMASGGDDPNQFVFAGGSPNPPGKGNDDWFHQNSATYNPTDNTLIVSSRENFVIAVDYDVPSDGIRKIHWILGDLTKAWYKDFKSLRPYALEVVDANGNYLPSAAPIGQHGISIDPVGNLMLMNDGASSGHHPQDPGVNTFQSAVYKYRLDLNKRTATATFGYSNYGPGTGFTSQFCGSAYDFRLGLGDSYLVDFATQQGAGGSPFAEIQGLRTDETLVFDLLVPDFNAGCQGGWNAVPLDLSAVKF